jgi:hypothetical protein
VGLAAAVVLSETNELSHSSNFGFLRGSNNFGGGRSVDELEAE